MVASSISRYRS